MARCTNCGSTDADVDIGLCYECFCQENRQPEYTVEDECESRGHELYGDCRCYCGRKTYPPKKVS